MNLWIFSYFPKFHSFMNLLIFSYFPNFNMELFHDVFFVNNEVFLYDSRWSICTPIEVNWYEQPLTLWSVEQYGGTPQKHFLEWKHCNHGRISVKYYSVRSFR